VKWEGKEEKKKCELWELGFFFFFQDEYHEVLP
jgi:hypothetical protein